jgi:hypothetical protein
MQPFLIIEIFVIPILSVIGFIFNLLSTIVFSLIIKNGQRDDMYKHLLLKSICEALGCFFSAFYPMYYGNDKLKHTYIMVVWFIWFERYVIPALFMASTGFEIAATFSCAISIEKKMKWCQKRLSFWLWVISILIVSFGVEMFQVFIFGISESNRIDQYNRTIHKYYASSNGLSPESFYLAESIIKEVILLLILLAINIYILFKLIQIGRRKRRLTSNNQNSNRTENRKIIMIIVLFLTFLLGHLPSFLWSVIRMSGLMSDPFKALFWGNFLSYGLIFFYFSFATSFFVYFAFNSIFKSFFMKIIHFRLNN